MADDDSDKDRSPDEGPFGIKNLYLTAYVQKDYPHEVRVMIVLPNTVVDFSLLLLVFLSKCF